MLPASVADVTDPSAKPTGDSLDYLRISNAIHYR